MKLSPNEISASPTNTPIISAIMRWSVLVQWVYPDFLVERTNKVDESDEKENSKVVIVKLKQ